MIGEMTQTSTNRAIFTKNMAFQCDTPGAYIEDMPADWHVKVKLGFYWSFRKVLPKMYMRLISTYQFYKSSQ